MKKIKLTVERMHLEEKFASIFFVIKFADDLHIIGYGY